MKVNLYLELLLLLLFGMGRPVVKLILIQLVSVTLWSTVCYEYLVEIVYTPSDNRERCTEKLYI